MTLDNFVEADILSTCNALGTEIRGVYQKGNDCIECLKDILRYLKRDSDTHSILRYLGTIRLLQTDLLPIVKRYDKDNEIFDFSLRILVALTNPALLLYKEDLPEDKISRNLYLQIISFLQTYKKAFVDVGVWKILYEHLKDLLKIRPNERSSDENLLIERMIILIRNVLHVPPDESIQKQTDDDLSLHDKILWSLHESKIDILLLYMCANEEEHEYSLHILEIIYLMLREHTSDTLANCNETRTNSDKQKDIDILLAARQREQNVKLQKIQTVSKSRFNGVYCVKNMKSLSDKDYIAHKLITNVDDVKFDLQKNARCKPKNRVRAPDVDNTRQSTLSIRLFLKKICIECLKSYNKLLVSVKRELLRKVTDEHDETYYLWAVCFFMKFNRLHDFEAAFVSETISTQTFHHIQTQITNYHEMMLTDKKKTMFWAKRMQLGVSAYKELLETLRKMERSKHENIKNSADVLVSHVFYVIEYREMLLSLLSSFDEVKFPLSYLAELVESTQLFLKMLENHSKKHSEIIVQKKQRKVNRRKKKKPVVVNEPVNEEELLNEQWDTIASELSNAVLGRRPISNVTPFDGASNISFEEQKVEAVYQIREAVIGNEPFKAVGLLRAARELWPEGESFGADKIDSEPEFLILREIHFSNLKKDPIENLELETEEVDDDEDEEMESRPSVADSQLDLNDVYKKYASPKVVQPCALLLANYQNNKPQTNNCLVKLLHRIAWNCKMHALFFQSTIFLTFQKIFHDPDIQNDPVIKEFYRFAKFIVQKFFSTVEKNNKVYVELLFWKGAREAYELEEGYGASENKIKGWTEDDEEELKYLFEENKDIYMEGQDVADIILANFNKGNRTKIQVISALKWLGLIKSAKELKPEKRSEWVETEIVDLRHLFEDFQDYDDVMTHILERLTIKRSRKAVVDKLLELNLIQDRKQVRKKASRNKKSKAGGSDGDSSDENEEPFDNTNDEINEVEKSRINSESSDEDERNFFRNLEAERIEGNSLRNETNVNDDNISDNLRDVHPTQEKKRFKTDSDKKAKSKKLSKIWEEQEIMQLTTLFRENHEEEDIMHVLLGALTVKRPKQAIVEKLLELQLIKDKKEVRKKRKSKSRKDGLIHVSNSGKSDESDNEDNLSGIENSINDRSNDVLKQKKGQKNRILSDSSDEDIPLYHTLMDSKINKNNAEKPKKMPTVVWEEEQIIELTRLYLENKDSDNVMASILKGLTVKKSEKDIKEKLLEIKLVKDKKELKQNVSANGEFGNNAKPKRKKPSDLWEEQEIIELNRLFQESEASHDIMGYIMNGLTVKRSKQNVLIKLLEMGLISDKKEVRKKRISKAVKNKKQVNSSDVSDEDSKGGYMSFQKKKYKKSILSDSSDDESLPLNCVIASTSEQNTDSFNNHALDSTVSSHKKKIKKTIMSESSDDESLPLGDIISPISKQYSSKGSLKKKSIMPESSDDESLPLGDIISSPIFKPHSSRSSLEKMSILSDSSEDESRPLNHAILLTSKQSTKTTLKEVSTQIDINKNHKTQSSLNFLTSKSSTEKLENEDSPLKDSTKRKRLLISSDDSSDDDSTITRKTSNADSLVLTDLITDRSENDFSGQLMSKMKKKKIRMLDDSDDSS